MATHTLFSLIVLFGSCASESAEDKKRRVCRSGCGVEKSAGVGDTPGFTNVSRACIIREIQGYKQLLLPRKHQNGLNVILTSLALVHGWRANCDTKILLYESDPMSPNSEDIAKVCNYIVSYTSKGTETMKDERRQILALIMSTEETSGCEKDVVVLARRLLHHYVGEKMFSKQECMVHLTGMDLYHCSESFERISLTGYTRMDKNGTKGANRFIREYSKRPDTFSERRKSFVNWFLDNHSQRGKYTIVPFFPGRSTKPIFLLDEYTARRILMIHKPWSQKHPLGTNKHTHELRSFLKSKDCPISV